MNRSDRFRSIAVAALVALPAAICPAQGRIEPERPHPAGIENPRYDSIIVADVGNRSITAQEFLFSYEFGPAFTRRESDARHRYLNFMIYEKLLALEGYERRLDTTGLARRELAEIEGDLSTEELYKDDVRSKVRVTPDEIERGVQRERNNLALRWLYTPSRPAMDNLVGQLSHGVPFDTLFRRQLRDSVTADMRSMKTTSFRLGIKNPPLATVVETLAVQEPSRPIRAPDGYYLVRVDDRSTDVVLTQTEDARLHSDVERAIAEEKSDSLSDLYIRHLMEGQHPVIIRRSFDIVETYLAKTALSPATFSEWRLEERLRSRWGDVQYDDPQSYAADTLVTLRDRMFSVQEFIDWYRAREYAVHLVTAAPEALFRSVEELVWHMVRDRLLMARAAARGMQHRPNVRRQVRWWQDKIAYKLVRAGIGDSIRWDDSLLKRYYDAHLRDYRDAKGNPKTFETAKDDVLRDYYAQEMTRRLLHRLQALKQKYAVRVRESELKDLPLDDEFDPKAIDVYAVKKGGTFPRQAFPTIDYEWQTWN